MIVHRASVARCLVVALGVVAFGGLPLSIVKQHDRPMLEMPGPLRASAVLVMALLAAPVDVEAAADATWKTHEDRNCGIQFKYPAAYVLEASGARDYCAPWIMIGPREAPGLRALFSLEIRTRDNDFWPRSARDFALELAKAQCTADGDDSSTYCSNGVVRSTFKTAQGFRGFEIHLTQVHETFEPKKIETQPRGPIFALDLSDDEVVCVLMAEADPGRGSELKAILDTFRVWTRARRTAPQVVEMSRFQMSPFRGAPQAFVLMVGTGEEYRANRWPPGPVTSWVLTDPLGRRLGRDRASGTWYSEAPAVTFGTALESGFMLRESVEGRYLLQITASLPSVPYHVAVQAPDQAGQPATVRRAGRTAEPGAVDGYEIVYSRGSTSPVTIAEVAEPWRFSVLLSSRGDVTSAPILTDPQGRQTGPARSVFHVGRGTRSIVFDVRHPMDGPYLFQVTGTSPGSYTLALDGWDRAGTAIARPELRDVPTGPGVVHLYRVDYASAAGTPLKLGRRFQDDRLLAYANVPSADIRLKAGIASFPLAIFYGPRINPVTFNALMNGDNISGRFTPEPEGYQIVPIPLVPGVNTLVLSVEGVTASGQTATDTHRLVFRVE